MSNKKKTLNDQNEENEENEQGLGGFIRMLLWIACACACIPAGSIPWNRTEWHGMYYVEYSSGFFLRALKVILIAISVIAWLIFLYGKYKEGVDGDNQDE